MSPVKNNSFSSNTEDVRYKLTRTWFFWENLTFGSSYTYHTMFWQFKCCDVKTLQLIQDYNYFLILWRNSWNHLSVFESRKPFTFPIHLSGNNSNIYIYIYIYIYIMYIYIHIYNWINVCPERDLNPRPPITSRVWSPLHHQDNHPGNTAIEEVIHVVRAWASRETFLSRWQGRGAYNSTWNPTKDQVNDARP